MATYQGVDGQINLLVGQLVGFEQDDDTIIGGNNSQLNQLEGDVLLFPPTLAEGGDDVLIGGTNSVNFLFGEIYGTLVGNGGIDNLLGGSGSVNELYGDAVTVVGLSAVGGNDFVTGGVNAHNIMFGDAKVFSLGGIGGDDAMNGGANSYNEIYGDAEEMFDEVTGAINGVVATRRELHQKNASP